MSPRRPYVLPSLVAATLLAVGCRSEDPIRSYSVPKESDPPVRVAASQKKQDSPASLTYDTPEGWQKAPPVMFSKATLATTDGDEKALLTVTDMRPAQAQLIPNVTRWRRQIGLPPATPEEIAASTTKMKVGERTADLIELVGPEKNGRREKFIIAMLPADDKVWIVKLKAEEKLATKQKDNFDKFVRSLKFKKQEPVDSGPVADDGPASLAYDTPEGWQKAPEVMFSKATLATTDGDERALLTVTDMRPAQAQLIPNVTRWRRQIGLPPATPEEIAASTTKMKVGERTADLIELVGPEKNGRREKFIIAMLPADDKVWIVKLKAEEKLATKQKDNFDKFVRSLKFKKAAP